MSDYCRSYEQPNEHDFTHGVWGHALSYFEPISGGFKVLGHGLGIRKGDIIRLRDRVFTVQEIDYFNDPRDMFSSTVTEHKGK